LKCISEYKHVIWDWNGTLLDDVWICMEIINKMLYKRSLPILDQERYKTIFGFPIKDYYQKAGFDFDMEPFEDLAKEYIEEYDSRSLECKLHLGVMDMLQKIRSLGISQSILSASNEESLRSAIRNFGIQEYFSYINGLSNHYAESKIEIGSRWLETQELMPSEVLIIGDSEHDYEVAKAMNVDCMLVSHGHQSFERLMNCNKVVYESLLQMHTVISRFAG